MKRLLLFIAASLLLVVGASPAFAGDCKTRDEVNWHATITSVVFVRDDCPSGGDIVGTVPGGEVVRILEVDRYNEFYLVETSVGTGFLFASFLTDITYSALPGTETYPDSIFIDLNPSHQYYSEIADVKAQGIVSGTPDGEILADEPINRVELAKILVEATTDDTTIDNAVLGVSTYSDDEYGAWYSKYLQIAREKYIMRGDSGATTVRPGDNANGAEVAKMIAVAFDLEIPAAQAGEDWYDPYMDVLDGLGALPYSGADHLVTRGEMMFMVSNVL